MVKETHSITNLLRGWQSGDDDALEQLTPLVYDELRRLAARYLRSERADHTLQATALVHEAFIEIRAMHDFDWQSRAHFIGIAARLMRRILVDHARSHQRQKRGGNALKVPVSLAGVDAATEPQTDLVDLDEALNEFARRFPRQARVVELRFFGGLTFDAVADVLSGSGDATSLRTVGRDWEFARAWLRKHLTA